ncbi:hypothetical protein C8035_v011294 [Colletotrichum spinosum]|uniref:Uncharacterized protein n=1 Tax=Colletotrichum spinosum TaxID=1347390 RepID=A0A4R8PYI6_9PEZI|nr:hypothetical protein C8035_v011294 [Colletotrichum spinosum]
MHFHHAIVWSALAIAAHADGPCASAPYHSGGSHHFNKRFDGWQANFISGHLRYTPNNDPNVAGTLELVNNSQYRRVMCVAKQSSTDFACWWLDGGDTCSTSILVNILPPAIVS